LDGRLEEAAVGQQVLVGARHHKQYVTNYRRNPDCRFYGHETWSIAKLRVKPGELSVGQAVGLGKRRARMKGPGGLRVEGNPFVLRLTCVGCGQTKELLRLQSRLRAVDQRCAGCGRGMVAAGRDLSERLEPSALPRRLLARSLHSLGFRAGDVFSVGSHEAEQHFEIEIERV
jgi:hypothetical protein